MTASRAGHICALSHSGPTQEAGGKQELNSHVAQPKRSMGQYGHDGPMSSSRWATKDRQTNRLRLQLRGTLRH